MKHRTFTLSVVALVPMMLLPLQLSQENCALSKPAEPHLING
jgi:hypothetical protein